MTGRSIPLVLFLLVGGVVADRCSRSMVMQVSHVMSAATQGTVAVLLLTGTAQLWIVVILEALNGIVSAFTLPAMQGVVPLVVPRTHLQQANALLGFSRNGLALHEHIPNDVHSRVNSYDALGSFVAIPIGQLTLGPLARAFDPADVMAVSAVACLAICLVTLLSRSVRDLRRAPSPSADPAVVEAVAQT